MARFSARGVDGGWRARRGGGGAVTGHVTFTIKDQARLGWPLLVGKGRYAVWVRLCRHPDVRGAASLRIARIVLKRVDGREVRMIPLAAGYERQKLKMGSFAAF